MREKSVVDCILTMNIIHFVILYHSLGFFFVFATLKVYLSVFIHITLITLKHVVKAFMGG